MMHNSHRRSTRSPLPWRQTPTAAVLWSLCLIVLTFFMPWTPASAQTSQGFTGAVVDSTGAVIPKAKITVHNHATGADKTAVSTGTGVYSVPFMSPGVYDVKVEAPGFKQTNKTDITLTTDQTVTVDFKLEPGAVSDTVTVNSSADVLDYARADRGQLMDGTSVTQLPVQAEDPFTLAQQVAGAYNNLNPTSIGPFNQTGQDLSIHGNQVQFNIDGLDNQSMTGSQNYEYDPPEGTMQEFKVTTEPYEFRGTPAWNTAEGTVYLVLGGGGTNGPTNTYGTDATDDKPQAKVITTRNAVVGSEAAGFVKNGADSIEDAPWSAAINPTDAYGYSIFDVDPGQRPGETTITFQYFAIPAVSNEAGTAHDGTTTLPTTPTEKFVFGRKVGK